MKNGKVGILLLVTVLNGRRGTSTSQHFGDIATLSLSANKESFFIMSKSDLSSRL